MRGCNKLVLGYIQVLRVSSEQRNNRPAPPLRLLRIDTHAQAYKF